MEFTKLFRLYSNFDYFGIKKQTLKSLKSEFTNDDKNAFEDLDIHILEIMGGLEYIIEQSNSYFPNIKIVDWRDTGQSESEGIFVWNETEGKMERGLGWSFEFEHKIVDYWDLDYKTKLQWSKILIYLKLTQDYKEEKSLIRRIEKDRNPSQENIQFYERFYFPPSIYNRFLEMENKKNA